MFTAYINAAMKKAHYEILPNNEGYFGKMGGSSRSISKFRQSRSYAGKN